MSGQQRGQPLTALPQHPQRTLDSPYLSAQECVQYLRLPSLRALYRLIAEHGLPYGRRGRIYLFDVRKLDRWIEMGGRVEQVSASAFGQKQRVG